MAVSNDPCGDHLPHGCVVRDRDWADRRHRYEVVEWCRRELTCRWQVTVASDAVLMIRTLHEQDHMLATMTWG